MKKLIHYINYANLLMGPLGVFFWGIIVLANPTHFWPWVWLIWTMVGFVGSILLGYHKKLYKVMGDFCHPLQI